MNPDAHAPRLGALGRDRVVEVARAQRVDRERRQLAQVAARRLARAVGLARVALERLLEAAREAAVEHQRLDHVARDVRASQAPHDLRAAAVACRAHAHEHEVADARARARRVHGELAAVAGEERARHGEAPAPLEHRGERGRRGVAHLALAASRRSAACSWGSLVAVGAALTTTLGLMPAPRRSPPAPRFWPSGR